MTADNAVDPIPIPKNARTALKDPVYKSQWKLVSRLSGLCLTEELRYEWDLIN